METINDTPITSTVVPDAERLSFLPRYFGRYMMTVEAHIFHHMSHLCDAYKGGLWHFVSLSNGGAFMAPVSDTGMRKRPA